jgi:hypothetical protein
MSLGRGGLPVIVFWCTVPYRRRREELGPAYAT